MGKIKKFNELYNSDGTYKLDDSYQSIIQLHEMLKNSKIPHEFMRSQDGWQIIYPEDGENRIADAVEFFGSYGSEKDLLEIMGSEILSDKAFDSVEGCLTAEDVYKRISKHYQKEKS